jgi:hypothetical protein
MTRDAGSEAFLERISQTAVVGLCSMERFAIGMPQNILKCVVLSADP